MSIQQRQRQQQHQHQHHPQQQQRHNQQQGHSFGGGSEFRDHLGTIDSSRLHLPLREAQEEQHGEG